MELKQDNREFWIIIDDSMLKSMLLDYIDVDISFIYETQLKIEWSADLKCQYHYQVLSCQHLNWKLWLRKQKYPLQKCSGIHLQSVFSIRQNNLRCARSRTSFSRKASVKAGHAHTHLWAQLAEVICRFPQSIPTRRVNPCQVSEFFREFHLSPASWISVTVSVLSRSWADGY